MTLAEHMPTRKKEPKKDGIFLIPTSLWKKKKKPWRTLQTKKKGMLWSRMAMPSTSKMIHN